jgi:leucyl aminopeptidase
MYDMHTDMQGSAVAVGTMLALSELRAPYDIDCWLAITENEIGARAFRPQEVVSAANGVTIRSRTAMRRAHGAGRHARNRCARAPEN